MFENNFKSSTPSSNGWLHLLLLLLFAAPNSDAEGVQDNVPVGAVGSTSSSTSIANAGIATATYASSLEASDAKIAQVVILNDNVFDLEDPREDKWLYRLANRIHTPTNEDVIRSQLLFHPGDSFSVQKMDESERVLRENQYLRGAEIIPVVNSDGTVDMEVSTQDVWTLTPSVSFGRSGGSNSGGIGLKEKNLFGTGTYIGASYRSDVDRTSTALHYADNNLMKSRYRFLASIANNSDGYLRELGLDRPFYALDTRHAGGLAIQQNDRVDSLYNLGSIVEDFQHASDRVDAYYGWSSGLFENSVTRFSTGIAYRNDVFAPNSDSLYPDSTIPDDRQYLYPFIGVEWLEDRFEKSANLDQINRIEDRYVGRRFGMRLGYSGSGMGSTATAWHFEGSFNDGLVVQKSQSLLLDGNFYGRYETGELNNAMLTMNAWYHRRVFDSSVFFARLSGSIGYNLDVDNPLYLGGDTGLRGYPLRYQGGDKKLLLTLEQRVFTDWYPFRLFHIGGAVFFDVGQTWGVDTVDSVNLGLLKDVGFGLRIGNSRSANGRVVHVDLAFPMDGGSDISKVQLLIEAKSSF